MITSIILTSTRSKIIQKLDKNNFTLEYSCARHDNIYDFAITIRENIDLFEQDLSGLFYLIIKSSKNYNQYSVWLDRMTRISSPEEDKVILYLKSCDPPKVIPLLKGKLLYD